MDRGPDVDSAVASGGSAEVEQAIFTSIRSPMGRGYRLVAASGGIRADEKREIIQCAPSHGSLCDPSPGAAGLASFPLRGGRHCVFLSRNAGIEQSARGGCRVHTHVLVMDQSVFARFQCNPLEVEAAALPAIGVDSLHSPPTRLGLLTLCIQNPKRERGTRSGRPPCRPADSPVVADADGVMHVLSAVLTGRAMLVLGAPTAQDTLRRAIEATPVSIRCRLSASCDIRFAPSRKFQLIFTTPVGPASNRSIASGNEAERITRDHDIEVLHWGSPPAAAVCPYEAWLRFVRRRWVAGRTRDVEQLSIQLTQEVSPQVLERLATLCDDLEQLPSADAAQLDQLLQKHPRVTPDNHVHARLLDEFKKAANARQEDLTRSEQDSATEVEADRL